MPIDLGWRRGFDLLAALSTRVVKVRPPAPPPADPARRAEIEREFERGELTDSYFAGVPFDPEFERFEKWRWAFTLRAMGEPPLRRAASDALETYRLLRAPSFRFPSVVRVTRRNSGWEIAGRLFLTESLIDPVTPLWERTRLLDDVEAARLERLLDDLRLWTMPVTVDRSGLDGESWFLEGVEAGSYHVVDRWSPREDEERPLVAFGEYLKTASGVVDYRPPPPSLRLQWAVARQQAAHRQAWDEEQRRCRESIRRSNRLSARLAADLDARGLTCPHCGRHSRDVRYVDKRPDGRSYFVCRSCSRSFHPE